MISIIRSKFSNFFADRAMRNNAPLMTMNKDILCLFKEMTACRKELDDLNARLNKVSTELCNKITICLSSNAEIKHLIADSLNHDYSKMKSKTTTRKPKKD